MTFHLMAFNRTLTNLGQLTMALNGAQLSNKFGYCPHCLAFRTCNSLPLGPMPSSSPYTKEIHVLLSINLWVCQDGVFLQANFLCVDARVHSPLGEVSLYGWSPALQVWNQLLHYIQIITLFFFGQFLSS